MRYEIPPVTIGMPQLGPYGLNENWLLRHIGDTHWRVICDALGKRSRDIQDELGNRLYASFVRVTWTASRPLSAFGENDQLSGEMSMRRFEDSIFLSSSSLSLGYERINAHMVSVFARRDKNSSNDRLLPAAPILPDNFAIPEVEELPSAVVEQRRLRSDKRYKHEFGNVVFHRTHHEVEKVSYEINGYQDFNGANLLYFASYPTIADICLSRTEEVNQRWGFENFVVNSSPKGRDIFYFGNANIGDRLENLIESHKGVDGLLAYRIDVLRKSDRRKIGTQFVLRSLPRM